MPGWDVAWSPVVDAAEVRRVRAPANPYEGADRSVGGTVRREGAPGSDEAWPPVVDAAEVRRVRAPANPYEGR
ncbi:hypothetical protein AB0K80_29655 [Streptomyces sp. NPDC052682]|uniref:hypothetical protein n=1 Tax=Streptomyces sp. NPDC052682 TaxID=3154954 RepID=UPI003424F2F8